MPVKRFADILRRREKERMAAAKKTKSRGRPHNVKIKPSQRHTEGLVCGIKHQCSGADKARFSITAGLVGAGVSAIDSNYHFRHLLDLPPQDFMHALGQAAIIGFSTSIATGVVGAGQKYYGKIIAGRNLKKLKPMIWKNPQFARKTMKRLLRLGEIDDELIQTIKFWGQGIETPPNAKLRKETGTEQKPRPPPEIPPETKQSDIT